jgi:hypothetical protein
VVVLEVEAVVVEASPPSLAPLLSPLAALSELSVPVSDASAALKMQPDENRRTSAKEP